MDNSFIALGLMSGTSLDGIDASIIKSDGENNLDIIDNKYFNYPEEFRKRLSSFILNINNRADIEENISTYKSLERDLTLYHSKISKKIITGGTKVNESDGYCAALPYFLFNDKEKEIKKVIKSVANSRINEKYALSKLKIIDLANKKDRNPVQSFVKKYKKNKYFKDVINNIKKVLRLKNQNHIMTVRKFGKACSYPGTFMGSIHAIITSNSYKSAITKTIKAGGCNCSRANFVGAYFAALKPESIPSHWVRRTLPAKNILKYINS